MRRVVTLLLFLLGTSCAPWNGADEIDLRADVHAIEQKILSLEPLGTELETARRYFSGKNFRVDQLIYPGSKTPLLKVYAGSYKSLYKAWFPVTVDVTVFFRFDRKNRLIDVWAQKTSDTL